MSDTKSPKSKVRLEDLPRYSITNGTASTQSESARDDVVFGVRTLDDLRVAAHRMFPPGGRQPGEEAAAALPAPPGHAGAGRPQPPGA
jgi:hypothetical protein